MDPGRKFHDIQTNTPSYHIIFVDGPTVAYYEIAAKPIQIPNHGTVLDVTAGLNGRPLAIGFVLLNATVPHKQTRESDEYNLPLKFDPSNHRSLRGPLSDSHQTV